MYYQKFKIWAQTAKGAAIASGLTVTALALVIFLPIVLTASAASGNITAYNRDGNSGARASFDDFILNLKPGEKVSSNVLELKGAAIMQKSVTDDVNGIGYVSAGQLIDYPNSDASGGVEEANDVSKLKFKFADDINVLSFDGTLPSQYNVNNDLYEGSKEFNMFFRVEKDDVDKWEFDSENTTWKFDTSKGHEYATGWALYNYLAYSTEVQEILPLAASTINQDDRVPFRGTGNAAEAFVEEFKTSFPGVTSTEVKTNGSTSVINSLMLATRNSDGEEKNDEFSFNSVITEAGMPTEITTGHSGSGDAYKRGTNNEAYSVGFLSRGVRAGEPELWGYEDMNDPVMDYSPWENDAMIIFVNKNNPTFKNNGDNITREQVRLIYLFGQSLNWDQLII